MTWCLCRWRSAYTPMILDHRGGIADTEEAERRKASLDTGRLVDCCGPLSELKPGRAGVGVGAMNAEVHLGQLGFPNGNIGKVKEFASREAAQLYVDRGLAGHQDGVSIDKPAPLDAFEFHAESYSHYDGKTTIIHVGCFQTTRAEWALAKIDAPPNTKVTLRAFPKWKRLHMHMPTREESARLWDAHVKLDGWREDSLLSGEKEHLAGLRTGLTP